MDDQLIDQQDEPTGEELDYSPRMGDASRRWMSNGQSKPSLPQLDVKNAYKALDFFTKEPQWLGNPATKHVANSIFAGASKVISMNLQMERLNRGAKVSQTQNKLGQHMADMLDEVAKVDPDSVADLFVPNEDGKLPANDLVNFPKVSQLYKRNFEKKDVFKDLGSTLGKLLADKEKFKDDPEKAKLFDSAIQQTISNKGRSIYMGMDDQGKPIFSMSEGGATPIGVPTVATESKAQQKLLKYEAATMLINDLQRTIKPEFLGAQGSVGEMVVDRGLAQLVPDMANKSRVDFRAGLIAARESLLREMSDDTRFSNADREEISKALPSNGVFESLPAAQQRLKTVRRILAQRGKIYSKGIGVKPPAWAYESPEEIKSAYQSKEISESEAIDALEKFH